MDYGQVNPGTPLNGGNWGSLDQADWATDDDYKNWNANMSVDNFSDSSFDGKNPQNWSETEHPNKKSKSSQSGDSQSANRSKAIGKMFFKTKLCCKFRAGTCPYTTNCNFAHSIEELRRPPQNWHEIVAAHEEETMVSEPREEFQIPSIDSSVFSIADNTRSFKGRRCKKFYTDEGCPYGDSCTFLHDEQSRVRESVAISLNPGTGAGYGGGGGGGVGVGGEVIGSNMKPPTWKTRICNKWEMTGYCPFGTKCHFAHGAAELHQYGGGLVEIESEHSMSDLKQGTMPSKTLADTVVASITANPHSDYYRIPHRSTSSSAIAQRPGQNALHKWKGPHKISRIYGDWIDDIE